MNTIRVYLVEDQPKIMKSLIKLMKGFEEIQIVGQAMSGEEALEGIAETDPEVVLLDLGLPQMSGITATREIKKKYPQVEVLIFTVFDEVDKVMEAIQAGASGYILKGTQAEKIVEAIRDVNDGGSVIQPSLARTLLRQFRLDDQEQQDPKEPYPNLTPREVEILQIIAKGLSNAEAAKVLNISRATIRTHLEHIYAKMSVSNRVEAITEGIRQGLIDV
jgi:DNA-binding NarL/FixJ family response regulator